MIGLGVSLALAAAANESIRLALWKALTDVF